MGFLRGPKNCLLRHSTPPEEVRWVLFDGFPHLLTRFLDPGDIPCVFGIFWVTFYIFGLTMIGILRVCFQVAFLKGFLIFIWASGGQIQVTAFAQNYTTVGFYRFRSCFLLPTVVGCVPSWGFKKPDHTSAL